MDTRTNCGFADGWSKPHPYSEVLAKQQFTGSPAEAYIAKKSTPKGAFL